MHVHMQSPESGTGIISESSAWWSSRRILIQIRVCTLARKLDCIASLVQSSLQAHVHSFLISTTLVLSLPYSTSVNMRGTLLFVLLAATTAALQHLRRTCPAASPTSAQIKRPHSPAPHPERSRLAYHGRSPLAKSAPSDVANPGRCVSDQGAARHTVDCGVSILT